MGTRYAALIRGINVGRAKRVSMADLRALMDGLGFHDCRTLLNSGNIVFTASGVSASIGARIEQALVAELGVAARTIVLSVGEFADVVEQNHLPKSADDPSRVLVAFVREAASVRRLTVLQKERWNPEVLALGKRAAYLWCPGGVGTSPLWEAVGRVLGEDTTARNWATVRKLQALF